MDIFNRPPSISEDTVIYALYPPVGSDRPAVASLLTRIYAFVQDELLPANHIWHRDSFDLRVIDDNPSGNGRGVKKRGSSGSDASASGPDLRIEGTMRVGDCVDDEWLVVWLLYQISERFDVVINVYDSDGEFLLIEAAEYIPSWLTPENAGNRVWIYRSHLHIIPLEYVSADVPTQRRRTAPTQEDSDGEQEFETSITIKEAVAIVRNENTNTQASKRVEDCIGHRIEGYPVALRQHIHYTKAVLPADVVLALSQNPSLVQKAVEAFYTRDALQLRVVSRMARFPPSTSAEATLVMTRTAYAQLAGQRFRPPKVFGIWNEEEGSSEWRHKDIGMKVACGFEMLYAENKTRSQASSSALDDKAEASLIALRRDTGYQKYIKDLKGAGYFPADEMEGSNVWRQREKQAAAVWVRLKAEENANRPSFTALVDEALSTASPHKDDILSHCSTMDEDSPDWLNISQEDVDEKLAGSVKRGGPAHPPKATVDTPMSQSGIRELTETEEATELAAAAEKQAAKLGELAQSVRRFVKGKSDVEGARFEDEPLSDEDDNDADELELSDPLTSDSEEDEPDEKHKHRLLENLVAPIDPAEYGKMTVLPETEAMPRSKQVTPITLETETRTMPSGEKRKIRRPILTRDRFDGVDSDDESSDDEDGQTDTIRALHSLKEEDMVEDEDDDALPQVVGGVQHDVDMDMLEEEADFIKFSREALGISDTHWDSIVSERNERGAFVPKKAKSNPTTDELATNIIPDFSATTASAFKGKNVRFFDAIAQESESPPNPSEPSLSKPTTTARAYKSADLPRNPNLDSFEAVMEAMEEELEKSRSKRRGQHEIPISSTRPSTSNTRGKGKAAASKAPVDVPELEDIDQAMDEELRRSLRVAESSDEESDEASELMSRDAQEAGADYNLIKNFLKSFNAQEGMSGPVGNMAGRLQPDWKLPRDAPDL